MVPKGLLLHSTGANNPNLRRYVGPDDGKLGTPSPNNWNQARPDNMQKCVHAFIGKLKDGSIASYKTLPWDCPGWHSGVGKLGKSKNANNTGYIGVEICEDNLTDRNYFNKVYKEATELFAYLCIEFKLNPLKEGVILCHSEAHTRGIASNHGDVMHWFKKHDKTMDDFRSDVAKLLGMASINNTKLKYELGDIVRFTGDKQYLSSSTAVSSKAKSSIVKITKVKESTKHPYHVRSVDESGKFVSGVYGWVDEDTLLVHDDKPDTEYLVKVTTESLNIRSGPGTSYRIVGKIEDNGVYTIVEEKNGWGKLASKIGWIKLSYTKKIKTD